MPGSPSTLGRTREGQCSTWDTIFVDEYPEENDSVDGYPWWKRIYRVSERFPVVFGVSDRTRGKGMEVSDEVQYTQ